MGGLCRPVGEAAPPYEVLHIPKSIPSARSTVQRVLSPEGKLNILYTVCRMDKCWPPVVGAMTDCPVLIRPIGEILGNSMSSLTGIERRATAECAEATSLLEGTYYSI